MVVEEGLDVVEPGPGTLLRAAGAHLAAVSASAASVGLRPILVTSMWTGGLLEPKR